MLEETQVEVKYETPEEINVYADDFYIEQVVTNYITNAIKHVKEVDGEKYIKITNENYDLTKNYLTQENKYQKNIWHEYGTVSIK